MDFAAIYSIDTQGRFSYTHPTKKEVLININQDIADCESLHNSVFSTL
jgi:hypothetical protein